MKRSMRTMFVLLAIVLSFVAVQSVFADTRTIEGTIDTILTNPNMIVVRESNGGLTDIYGVRFPYLEKYNIRLELNDEVSVQAYEYECSDGTIKLKACEITVDNVTVYLRTCQ